MGNRPGPTRRLALLGGGLALVARPALAAEFVYRDWHINTDGVGGTLPEATIKSLQTQIDIVESVPIKPQIKDFFRNVPTQMARSTPVGPGAYSFDLHRMVLALAPQPPDNPVLLHELIHAYHDQKLGLRNPQVLAFYQAAKRGGDYPSQAYLYKNPAEFLAMCASVVLWGKAARPPYLRATVHQKYPALYDWIVTEFGLEIG